MNRRSFLKLIPAAALPVALSSVSGCGYFRIDPSHYLIRSDYISSPEHQRQIVSKARVERTEDGRIRVLYVQGTPYEMGYQHGYLLRHQIQDNVGFIYNKAVDKYHMEELFDEAYERMRPYIPNRYVEEMHGLAHGSRLPLRVIHAVHVLPEIGEWSGTKRIGKLIKSMMNDELPYDKLGTSCSNFSLNNSATPDKQMYVVRILDWGLHRISKLHEYPLLTVARPNIGHPYLNIGWVGFLGAVSGINEQGITLGEMGYGSPPNETLRGKPMTFLLRDVLSDASNLADVRKIISESPGTNSFVFLMTDGKTGDAELYVRDRDRFLVSSAGETVTDGDEHLPGIKDVVYGGHFDERMTETLQTYHGTMTPELIMDHVIPYIAMDSNFQNVVYDPVNLRIWVNNAASKKLNAMRQPYTIFDFKKALENFPKV